MAAPQPRVPRQLMLPLLQDPTCPSLLLADAEIPVQCLWATCSPPQQEQIRRAVLRVIVEVLHDAPHR